MGEVRKIPERSEIAQQYKWALEDLFETDEQWEAGCAGLEEKLSLLEEYPGTMGESAGRLLSYLRLRDDVECAYERLLVYANQKLHQDMSVSKYQGYSARIQNIGVRLAGAEAFAEPEILSLAKENANIFSPEHPESFYQKEPELKEYRVLIDRILYQKEHTLSEKEEALLAQTMELSSAASDIYTFMNNADLKFGHITDDKGMQVELSQGNFVRMLENSDRNVRKQAFETYYRVYDQFKNSIAAMYQANVKQAKFYADARHYASSLEMALDGSRIPTAVYDSLIDAVHDALPEMYRYVALRKKVLQVEELHMYDVYVPLTEEYDATVTYEEAKEKVLAGLAPLGEAYAALLRKGFDEHWIDVYENRNKKSGAYSWAAYGVHPYVLLNYQGRLNDVFTLAHEMGHALHSYYTNETQPYVYSGYQIFVAEVASTCNEALLMQHLLGQCTEPQEKIYLLNYFLDQFKGTLFRQTMFAEFEKITHQMYADGEALTAERICEVYLELNRKYFGPDMVSDPQIALEWARIPHFYREFYVYQYATGFSAAIALSQKILTEGETAVEAYKSFLKGGCSKDPLQLLQVAGVDLSSPEPVRNALRMFGELVTQLEELLIAKQG